MKEKTYTQDLDTKHPWFVQQKGAIESFNLLSDRIRENHEAMFSKIYFVLSLILSSLIAVYIESHNWVVILTLINLLMILLIIFAKKYHEKRKGYVINKKRIRKSFKELGLEWRE